MPITPIRCVLAAGLVAVGLAIGACAEGDGRDRNGGGIDSTPEKIDGTPSQEFEAADIERAEGASKAVQDYCSGAVSEAQEVGCLSHVDESDVP